MKVLVIGNGYVGSFLANELRQRGLQVTTSSRTQNGGVDVVAHYQDLSSDYLDNFEAILWFAGHSSVPEATKDPFGAVNNNVTDLLCLLQKIAPHKLFIYASSASVYNANGSGDTEKSNEKQVSFLAQNIYDATKIGFDAVTQSLTMNTVGLRMGTVSGWGTKIRKELIFNAMNISAIEEGRVRVSNGSNRRSILFLKDLTNLVLGIIKRGECGEKFLNAASYSASIEMIGRKIADFHDVDLVEENGDVSTYSFQCDTRIADEMFNYKYCDFIGQCKEIKVKYDERN